MKAKIDQSGKHRYLFFVTKEELNHIRNLRMTCRYNDFVKEVMSKWPELNEEQARSLVYSYYEGYSNIEEVKNV